MLSVLLAALIATPALASPADDAALAASETIEENCARGASGGGVERSDALVEVARVLGRVDAAYEVAPVPFLLYWRGLIYQCLGQFEDATTDLEAFVEAERGSAVSGAQVKTARLRLGRLGKRVARAGAGDAAAWVRRPDPIELEVGVAGGIAAQARSCTESLEPSALMFQRCDGQASAVRDTALGAQPVDVTVAWRGFPANSLGVAVRVGVGLPLPRAILGEREPAPTVGLRIGPGLRLTDRLSRRRAVAAVLEPAFALAVVTHEPQAGHYNHLDPASEGLLLDGGAWTAVQLGGGIRGALRVEVSNRAVLELAAAVAGYGPSSGELLLASRAAEDAVVQALTPVSASRLVVDGSIRLLLLRIAAGGVVVGPSLGIRLDDRWLQLPDGTANAWGPNCTPGESCSAAHSKVFSTHRTLLAVTAGLVLEFGGTDR